MNYFILLLTMTFSSVILSAQKFGKNISKSNIQSVEKIVKNEANFQGKEVTVHGVVEKICVKKGCWLNLGKGDKTVRVTFKNYGIFVPSNFLGEKVAIQGIFKLTEESVERQRHLLEDEGKPRSEIEKITSPKKTYSIVATGIEII